MKETGITLLYAAETSGDTLSALARLGFGLISLETGGRRAEADGIAADGWTAGQALGWLEQFVIAGNRPEPLLLLLWGDRVKPGLADAIAAACPPARVEIVRLWLLNGGERAVLGGTGVWAERLRRCLADRGVISLVCRPVEVDEAASALPLYLSMKRRFYQTLGERCDRVRARLDVVAQALGMDKRVGQGWLGGPEDDPRIDPGAVNWLLREWHAASKKTNIRSVAVWARPSALQSLSSHLLRADDVRLYIPRQMQIPNNPTLPWMCLARPEDTLIDADALLIADADEAVRTFPLDVLRRRMRRPIVVDACSCYPVQEAEAFALCYRTYGQNTNIWEWIDESVDIMDGR